MKGKNFWTVKERNWPIINDLIKELGISSLAAQMLINRGIEKGEDARIFFDAPLDKLDLLYEIPGIREAAVLTCRTIGNGEKIIVFGDYDADGVTGTALMVKGLRKAGGRVDYYVPDRFSEGYDLNEDFIQHISCNNYALLITVDCGIKAFSCIHMAGENGLKTIVTDHHEPGDEVPDADTVINPKLKGDDFTRDLAGVGVALALVRAVWQELKLDSDNMGLEMLELACIGTIADSVPLVGCNRIIVRHGLKKLGETANIGLAALFEVEGLKGKKEFEVNDISFKIGPCINAVGRIGDANDAVALLVSDFSQESWELAKKLHRDNALRQNLDGTMFLEAVEKIEQEIDLSTEKVIVLASENWHPGVVGITAARVVQKFNMPAVLISVEEGIGKGSGRSIGNFNINRAFGMCSDLLLNYGGHKLAGGFSIAEKNISDFRRRINEYAEEACEGDQCLGEAEGEVVLQDMDFGLLEEIEAFKPFGPGNPVPQFVCNNVQIVSTRLVGKKNEHLKLIVSSGDREIGCIGFRMAEKGALFKQGDFADIVFSPQMNTWNGSTKVQLILAEVMSRSSLSSGKACLSDSKYLEKEKWIEYLEGRERILYLGTDGEDKFLSLLPILQEASVFPVVLFPLLSMAADFERRFLESCQSLKLSTVDCVTSNEDIRKTAGSITRGSTDCLVTSLGTWLANDTLLRALERKKTCLCIYMGNWGTMFPPADLLREIEYVLSDWRNAVFIVGSGKHLGVEQLGKIFGITAAEGENNFCEPDFFVHHSEDRLRVICEICSETEKSVILVNSGREALELSREIAKSYPKKTKTIRSYLGKMLHNQKQLILGDFNYGTTDIIVASRILELYSLNKVDSLIMDSFPLNMFDFNRFLVAQEVHLTYDNSDIQRAYEYVQSLCPDDSIFEYVGRNLKHSAHISFPQMYQKMEKGLCGRNFFTGRTLSIALSILTDEFFNSATGGGYNGDEKKSWRYLEARKEIDSFNLLAEKLGADCEAAVSSEV